MTLIESFWKFQSKIAQWECREHAFDTNTQAVTRHHTPIASALIAVSSTYQMFAFQ